MDFGFWPHSNYDLSQWERAQLAPNAVLIISNFVG